MDFTRNWPKIKNGNGKISQNGLDYSVINMQERLEKQHLECIWLDIVIMNGEKTSFLFMLAKSLNIIFNRLKTDNDL